MKTIIKNRIRKFKKKRRELKKTHDAAEICGGNLAVELNVEEQPSWGDHYGELEIVVHCERCGKYVMRMDTMKAEGLLTKYVREAKWDEFEEGQR